MIKPPQLPPTTTPPQLFHNNFPNDEDGTWGSYIPTDLMDWFVTGSVLAAVLIVGGGFVFGFISIFGLL